MKANFQIGDIVEYNYDVPFQLSRLKNCSPKELIHRGCRGVIVARGDGGAAGAFYNVNFCYYSEILAADGVPEKYLKVVYNVHERLSVGDYVAYVDYNEKYDKASPFAPGYGTVVEIYPCNRSVAVEFTNNNTKSTVVLGYDRLIKASKPVTEKKKEIVENDTTTKSWMVFDENFKLECMCYTEEAARFTAIDLSKMNVGKKYFVVKRHYAVETIPPTPPEPQIKITQFAS